MMRRVYFVLVLVMGLAASASAAELGVRGSYWFPEFDATTQVGGGGLVGDRIDAVDLLGFDDENFPSLEIYAGLGSHHIALAGIQMNFDGAATLSQSFDFNGETYSFDEDVVSELDITMVDFYYQYDLLDLENVAAGFSLGPVLQVKYLDIEMSIESAGVKETESISLPIPMLGLGMHVGILADMIEVRARVAGMGYSDNSVFEATAELNFTPFPFVDIGGGYRYLAVDIDESDMVLDMTLSGPYVALNIGF